MSQKTRVIGYKLVEKQFEKEALAIAQCNDCGWCTQEEGEPDIDLTFDSDGAKYLKSAGALDLWFKKVTEKQFKVGDLVMVIAGDSIESREMDGTIRKIVTATDTFINVEESKSPGGLHPYELRHLTDMERLKYEKPKFKAGDVIVKVWNETKQFDIFEVSTITETGVFYTRYYRDGREIGNNTGLAGTFKDERYTLRKATTEEVEIFRDYNFLKLPQIRGHRGYVDGDNLVWGCTSIPMKSISDVLVHCSSLTLNCGKVFSDEEIDQIQKVIDFNLK